MNRASEKRSLKDEWESNGGHYRQGSAVPVTSMRSVRIQREGGRREKGRVKAWQGLFRFAQGLGFSLRDATPYMFLKKGVNSAV